MSPPTSNQFHWFYLEASHYLKIVSILFFASRSPKHTSTGRCWMNLLNRCRPQSRLTIDEVVGNKGVRVSRAAGLHVLGTRLKTLLTFTDDIYSFRAVPLREWCNACACTGVHVSSICSLKLGNSDIMGLFILADKGIKIEFLKISKSRNVPPFHLSLLVDIGTVKCSYRWTI